MKKKKVNIETITDELMEVDETMFSTDSQLSELINKTKISSAITAIGEEMREGILAEVNRRIDKIKRRQLWIRIGAVAASIALLLGITNYVSYHEGYKRQNSQIAEVTNPLGIQSSITLSDGTKVFLNAGTTLRYPTAFVSRNRVVEVEGEAFFDVVRDVAHPFIVKTENIHVRVVGTKFNVKTYKEEKEIEVTLEEGKVEVGVDGQRNFLSLAPGEQMSFNRATQSFSRNQVNLNHYITWKEGKFYFNSMTFEDIAKQLERRFNVKIYIASNELKQTVFTGDFVRKENLEQILRVMTIDKRISYKIEGDQVYIQ